VKRLTVLRHAKSSWGDTKLDDFDRPLNDRGRQAARRMGREIKRRTMRFDLVLASTAARVRETLDCVQEKYDFDAPIRFEPLIYMAAADTLLSIVRDIPDEVSSAMLVGHNPGLEQLLLELTRDDKEGLRAGVREKYPTGALAAVELPAKKWADVEENSGEVKNLILPRELD